MSITNSATTRSISNSSDDKNRLVGPIVELTAGRNDLTVADSGTIFTLDNNSDYQIHLPLKGSTLEVGTKITFMNNFDFGLINVNIEIYSDELDEAVGISLFKIESQPTNVAFIESSSGLANVTGQIPHFFKAEFIYAGNNVWKATSIASDGCLDEM